MYDLYERYALLTLVYMRIIYIPLAALRTPQVSYCKADPKTVPPAETASNNWKLDDDEGAGGMKMDSANRATLMARLGGTAGAVPGGSAASSGLPAAAAAAAAATGAAAVAATTAAMNMSLAGMSGERIGGFGVVLLWWWVSMGVLDDGVADFLGIFWWGFVDELSEGIVSGSCGK